MTWAASSPECLKRKGFFGSRPPRLRRPSRVGRHSDFVTGSGGVHHPVRYSEIAPWGNLTAGATGFLTLARSFAELELSADFGGGIRDRCSQPANLSGPTVAPFAVTTLISGGASGGNGLQATGAEFTYSSSVSDGSS